MPGGVGAALAYPTSLPEVSLECADTDRLVQPAARDLPALPIGHKEVCVEER